MFRSRDKGRHAAETTVPEFDVRLRDEPDPDPVVEEMVERLRQHLQTLEATDEWGRPVAWRNVVRLALGPTLARLRDADTAVALSTALEEQGASAEPQEPARLIDLTVPAPQEQPPAETRPDTRPEAHLGWPQA